MVARYTLSGAKRFEFIDALRGLAALAVVLVHTTQHCRSVHPLVSAATSLGVRGVQLFYILSALTLFLSLEERFEKEKAPFISFFIRRFFRIAPLFYIVIIINFFLKGYSPRYGAPEGISNLDLFSAFIFFNAWIPQAMISVVDGGWSVAVEMNFYALIPFLYKKIKGIKQALVLTLKSYIFLSLILSGILVGCSNLIFSKETANLYKDYFHTFWLPAEFFVFTSGICLFFLIKKELLPESQESNFSALFLKHLRIYVREYYLLLACFFITLITYSINSKFLWTGFFSLLITLVALKPVKFLVNRFTILVGKFSYSIYLLHFFTLELVDKILDKTFIYIPFMKQIIESSGLVVSVLKLLLVFALTLCCVMAISWLSYSVIEKNGIRLSKKITTSLNQQKYL